MYICIMAAGAVPIYFSSSIDRRCSAINFTDSVPFLHLAILFAEASGVQSVGRPPVSPPPPLNFHARVNPSQRVAFKAVMSFWTKQGKVVAHSRLSSLFKGPDNNALRADVSFLPLLREFLLKDGSGSFNVGRTGEM